MVLGTAARLYENLISTSDLRVSSMKIWGVRLLIPVLVGGAEHNLFWCVGLGVGVTAACFFRWWESPAGCVLALRQAPSPHGQHRAPPEVRGPGRQGRGSIRTGVREAMPVWVLHTGRCNRFRKSVGRCRWAEPEMVTDNRTRD